MYMTRGSVNPGTNTFGMRVAYARYDLEKVNEARRMLEAGEKYTTTKIMTGIDITTLRYISNDIQSERESERARKAGTGYIMKEIMCALHGRFKEKGGAYWLDGRPASIQTLIIEANKAIASTGNDGRIGKNTAWHCDAIITPPAEENACASE